MIKKNSALYLAASIIISMIIYSFSNRYQPSPVNESLVIDTWTGNIYDINGTNLTKIHKGFIGKGETNSPKINKLQ